ncbi:MAG: 3-keto-5-aminohexanoate cleavage protein [Thermodesulfobacteriota bacterium]|nr:3-keto-5-aminohexanoate cleavage protein [Thermodesulfobacteriota bacterium]
MVNKRKCKIIVSVAPVGKEVPETSFNPITPEEVAEEVTACAEAGASMVHLHVRDRYGNQTADLTDFSQTLDRIRPASDIIIQGSTGGLVDLSVEERSTALNDHRVQTASLNMGSVNFGDEVYVNTLPNIQYWARRMAEERIVPELEIFEAGMIPVYKQLMAKTVLRKPFSFNFILGVEWGMPAVHQSLFFLTSFLDQPIPWGITHVGMTDFSLLATAIGLGAAVVRVGFEDSAFYAPGKAAHANVELVERAVALVRHIGFDVATIEEARDILGVLK